MTTPLKIPDVGESIQEVQIGRWLKAPGDPVEQDETLVELETDKASMDLPSPIKGRLAKVLKQDGERVAIGEVIAQIESDQAVEAEPEREQPEDNASRKAPVADEADKPSGKRSRKSTPKVMAEPGSEPMLEPRHEADADEAPADDEEAPLAADAATARETETTSALDAPPHDAAQSPEDGERRARPVTPSGRRALRQYGLSPADIEPEGKTIRREDVERHVAQRDTTTDAKERPAEASEPTATPAAPVGVKESKAETTASPTSELEELVPMSLIRRRIAERLVAAQQTAALLTTFNEIDLSAVIALRQKYQDSFQNRYGVKLGFMSFFVKASIDALKQFPALNAEIRGENEQILFRNYYHIGIAIGSPKGLVVPVLRFAERMSFAQIEQAIGDLAARARNNKITPDELQGGTFTISNGGIYGSLLSTPIVNPPQSGVLGMHAIQERPIARDGQVIVRPMMYVALTYDHRIVDGAEAVTFLKRIKESIEDPARLLLEV